MSVQFVVEKKIDSSCVTHTHDFVLCILQSTQTFKNERPLIGMASSYITMRRNV